MKRARELMRRGPVQMALMLPPVPKDSPLREAFRRAELFRVGLDFRAVHGHPQGAALLRSLADAYARGHCLAARSYAQRIADLRRVFNAR